MIAPSVSQTATVRGVEVPTLLYGTAWKEERTAELVEQALAAGFRGIDTANQRRHYHEAAVGAALARARAAGTAAAEKLFLQTKYTYVEGQDARLPYDPTAELVVQVHQSLASSLEHLGVERIDSYLLHGPRGHGRLAPDDRRVWRAFEELHRQGQVRAIGVSNVTALQLAELCELADIEPAFVQNRCYARLGWDGAVRELCRARGILYQGFSLLTANRAELATRELRRIAERHGASVAQVIFRFALQLGMIALTGTTDPDHMAEDLSAYRLELSAEEVEVIERIST